MIKTWCRQCLLILQDNGTRLRHKGGSSNASSVIWVTARDYIGGGEPGETRVEPQQQRWSPRKKLTRYQMDYLRTLRSGSPELWTLRRLSKYFGISYISVVKILKSKFHPSEQIAERQDERAITLRKQRKQLLKQKMSTLHKAAKKNKNSTGKNNMVD